MILYFNRYHIILENAKNVLEKLRATMRIKYNILQCLSTINCKNEKHISKYSENEVLSGENR